MQLHPPELTVELQKRLLRGAHLTLIGPRGSGKSTLLAKLHSQFVVAGIPFLKRLHGKVAGVLTAVDVDDQRDRSRMRRPSRYGAITIRMPLTPTRQLRRLLCTLIGGLELPPLPPSLEQKLLEAARGRPGWIVKSAELACEPRYWCEHGLLVTALCVDTEAAVRYRPSISSVPRRRYPITRSTRDSRSP
jgi:hypothetical protein